MRDVERQKVFQFKGSDPLKRDAGAQKPMTEKNGFFVSGGRTAWGRIASVVIVAAARVMLFSSTVNARYERDVSRMVFNDNLDVLDGIKRRIGASTDTLKQILVDSTE